MFSLFILWQNRIIRRIIYACRCRNRSANRSNCCQVCQRLWNKSIICHYGLFSRIVRSAETDGIHIALSCTEGSIRMVYHGFCYNDVRNYYCKINNIGTKRNPGKESRDVKKYLLSQINRRINLAVDFYLYSNALDSFFFCHSASVIPFLSFSESMGLPRGHLIPISGYFQRIQPSPLPFHCVVHLYCTSTVSLRATNPFANPWGTHNTFLLKSDISIPKYLPNVGEFLRMSTSAKYAVPAITLISLPWGGSH